MPIFKHETPMGRLIRWLRWRWQPRPLNSWERMWISRMREWEDTCPVVVTQEMIDAGLTAFAYANVIDDEVNVRQIYTAMEKARRGR